MWRSAGYTKMEENNVNDRNRSKPELQIPNFRGGLILSLLRLVIKNSLIAQELLRT